MSDEGRPLRGLELRVPPLVVTLLFAVGALLSAELVPRPSIAFPGHRAAGGGLALAGLALAGVGVVEFRRAKTTVDPRFPGRTTSVVRTGVYRFSRNPMYVGFAAAVLGIVVWAGSAAGLAAIPLFVGYMNRFQIGPEEQMMLERFEDAYSRYMREVRRWL